MKVVLKKLFTGKDNSTYDIGRVLWAVGVLVYLGLSIFAVIQGQQWHPMEFGSGLAGVLAGGGIGIAVKGNTEPECGNND